MNSHMTSMIFPHKFQFAVIFALNIAQTPHEILRIVHNMYFSASQEKILFLKLKNIGYIIIELIWLS